MVFKNNKVYDVLKWIALVVFPALSTLYATLATAWNLPYGEQIGITIGAIATFLGTILMVSNVKYRKKVSDTDQH